MTRSQTADPFQKAAEAPHALAAATSASGHDIYVALGSGWAAVGGAVLLADQINFTGVPPMPGSPPPAPWSGRFVPLGDLYSPPLREIVREVEPGIPSTVSM